MGCDIHLFVEQKNADGKWVSADKWVPNEYAGEEGEPPMWVEYDDRLYSGRNYDLFGMLADVRNGRGFAGCDTGDGFKPIAMPKGLPSDVSPEVKAESDRWGVDGHSHSWLTLAELQAYDWVEQKTKQRWWVDPREFKEFEATGRPSSCCSRVNGPQVRHISNDEMRAHLESLQHPADTSREEYNRDHLLYYTQIEWSESYYESAKDFVDETLPKLAALSNGDPESIRIVFWFDN